MTLLQLLALQQGFLFSAENDTLIINQDFNEVAIGKYVRYLRDSTNAMTLDDFLEKSSPTQATLRKNNKDEVALGYSQSQFWLQINVRNELPDTQLLYLSIAYPNIDNVIIYERNSTLPNDSIQQIAQVGDNFKNGRKILPHRNYVVPVYLPPGVNTDFIIQVKKQWESINFPIFLSDEYYLVRRTNNDNLFLGIFLGLHFTFALLVLVVYQFTRNTFFLLYFFLNILSLFNIISDSGIGLQHIWPNFPFIQKILPYLSSFGMIVLHITFVRQFFSTSLHFGRFNTFLLGLLSTAALTLVTLITTALIFPDSNLPYQIGYNIINGLYLGYGFVILILCVVAYAQLKRKVIIWVMLAMSIQYFSWVLNIIIRGNAFPTVLKSFSIYELNLFPGYISTPHVIILVIVLEIVVVSAILALSFYQFIKDNASGKYRLLLLQRKTISAYIEGQEKERIRLSDRINESIKEDISMLKDQMNAFLNVLENPIARAKLNAIIDEVETIKEDVNRISSNFVPLDYVNKSFYDAVKNIFLPLQMSGIRIMYDLTHPEPKIKDFSKVNICRILQEVAGNARKHSGAKDLKVSITYNKSIMLVTVEDNGKGFDPDDKKGGIGLLNIESRVKGLNGKMELETSPGKGTYLRISIPIAELQ